MTVVVKLRARLVTVVLLTRPASHVDCGEHQLADHQFRPTRIQLPPGSKTSADRAAILAPPGPNDARVIPDPSVAAGGVSRKGDNRCVGPCCHFSVGDAGGELDELEPVVLDVEDGQVGDDAVHHAAPGEGW